MQLVGREAHVVSCTGTAVGERRVWSGAIRRRRPLFAQGADGLGPPLNCRSWSLIRVLGSQLSREEENARRSEQGWRAYTREHCTLFPGLRLPAFLVRAFKEADRT